MEKIIALVFSVFLVSCTGIQTSDTSNWALSARFTSPPKSLSKIRRTKLGNIYEEHRFLELGKVVYSETRGAYPIEVKKERHDSGYDGALRRFLEKKKSARIIERRIARIGSHVGRKYRMRFEDHVGDYIFIFAGNSLYIFAVEAQNLDLLNSSKFLETVRPKFG